MVWELAHLEVPAPVPVPEPGSPEYPVDEIDEPLAAAVVVALTPLPQYKGVFRTLPYPGRFFERYLTHELALVCTAYLSDANRWRSKREESVYWQNENRLEREFNMVVKQARELHQKRKAAQASATATAKKQKVPLTIDLTGDD